MKGVPLSRAPASLALVIPVYNDATGLVSLLRQVADLGCFDQLVIGDDASDQPVTLEAVPERLRSLCTVLRNAATVQTLG